MADIDQIIAGGAGASSRADFSGIAKLPEYYWNGKDQAAKNDLREAFKDGVPLGPDGQPDFGAMAKTLFQKGGLERRHGGVEPRYPAPAIEDGAGRRASDGPGRERRPALPIVLPAVANRGASVAVAPPLAKGGALLRRMAPPDGPQGVRAALPS
jgi:hypothetical protein